MVDLLTWQGLGDVVNKFRRNVLGLEELSPIWAPSLIHRAKIPYTYCWSPALIPKPKDWGAHIDISGFFFLDLANHYTPPDDLAAFLAAGPPPVYIGFGSIVVKNPEALTKLIFDAVAILGIRALVSKYAFLFHILQLEVGEVSVQAKFPITFSCSAIVLTIGFLNKFQQLSIMVEQEPQPLVFVSVNPPLLSRSSETKDFGHVWSMPLELVLTPQPFKTLTAEKLAHAIRIALAPEATTAAANLAQRMASEEGACTAAKSFHRMLPLKKMRCAVIPEEVGCLESAKNKYPH